MAQCKNLLSSVVGQACFVKVTRDISRTLIAHTKTRVPQKYLTGIPVGTISDPANEMLISVNMWSTSQRARESGNSFYGEFCENIYIYIDRCCSGFEMQHTTGKGHKRYNPQVSPLNSNSDCESVAGPSLSVKAGSDLLHLVSLHWWEEIGLTPANPAVSIVLPWVKPSWYMEHL